MENRIIERVSDIPESFTLITDSQDILEVLASIGQSGRDFEIGCMFVSVADGEYNEVYYSDRAVPYLDDMVYKMWIY